MGVRKCNWKTKEASVVCPGNALFIQPNVFNLAKCVRLCSY